MAHRKLQSEIDRVLKKVDEGVNQFEDTWEKVKEANTSNLKEKYEGDLKKEIKKLQRFRDQIKTWASSNEVKKKQPLYDARKMIESKMEKFKILEKETKTKAYSKEGLSKSSQRKKDPTKDPKYKSYVWIDDIRKILREQISEFEEIVDDLKSGGKKKQKENQDLIDDYNLRVERHNWHLEKLSDMRDRLKSGEISVNKVDELKDNVQYYVDSNQDPDFYEDEFLYDALDEPDVIETKEPTSKDDSESPGLPIPDDTVDDDEEEQVTAVVQMPVMQVSANYQAPTPKETKTTPLSTTSKSTTEQAPPPSPITLQPSSNTSNTTSTKNFGAGETFANLIRRNSSQEQQHQRGTSPALSSSSSSNKQPATTATVAQIVAQKRTSPAIAASPNRGKSMYPNDESPLILGQSSLSNTTSTTNPQVLRQQLQQQQQQSLQRSVSQPQLARRVFNTTATNNNTEMNPFAKPPSNEYLQGLQLMQRSLRYFPQTVDTDRSEAYTPRNPCMTPNCFPSIPLPEFDDPALFAKFDIDTLFFVFYFQQGTPQQYLAASELRKQSWRYHKSFLTWFQRHEDPTHATDEFEAGTYVYFDYESGWCSRIKKDFTFHYQHLEDDLPI